MIVHRTDNIGESVARELGAWHSTGLRIAIWGGTGESAAFLEAYGLDGHRFPIVVDSDPGSAGTYVPGTGQMIRFPDWLLDDPVAPRSCARSRRLESATKASSRRGRDT